MGMLTPPGRNCATFFASSCVEVAARRLNVSATDMYRRMKHVELFCDLIYPCYDTLHTQSRETVTDDVLEALRMRECKYGKAAAQ